MNIKRSEILRYLGYGKNEADSKTDLLIDECIDEIEHIISPKSIYTILPVTVNNDIITFSDVKIHSKNLAKNLNGCEKIVLFAATIGTGIDMLLKKYSCNNMSKAVVLQSTAAVFIEEYCDECQTKIENKVINEGYYVRPRFSPGYGDFSIKHQSDFIRILDCPRKIGLTLTDSLILIPSKSVTAVMGLSKTNQHCHKSGCEQCTKINCAFRRN